MLTRKMFVRRILCTSMALMLMLQPVEFVAAKENDSREVLYENTFEQETALEDFSDITGDLANYVSGQKSVIAEDEGHGKVWQLENGGGQGLGNMAYAKRLARNDTNVSYTFDLKIPKEEEAHVAVHSQEAGNCGYNFYLKGDQAVITKRSSDRGQDIPVKTMSYEKGLSEGWHTYKITIVDKTLALWIDEEHIVSAVDTDTSVEYASGGITFSGWGHKAYIDNLIIETATEEDIPGAEAVPFDMNEESLQISIGDSVSVSPIYEEIADKKAGFNYASDNEKVASVDTNGIVTANASGEAVITATAADGAAAETHITVNQSCNTFYYVSLDGNDATGNGTEQSPFRTIEKARDTIRSLSGLPDGGITVYLREGEYYIDETIIFTSEDSGEPNKPIVYSSYPNEEAVVHSGKQITGFTKLTKDYPAGLPEEAKGQVFVADVEPGWRFHDLYVNGERQQVARLFNTNDWSTWETFPKMPQSPLHYPEERGMLAEFQEGHLDNLPSNGDVELYLLPVQWWNSLPVVTDIDEENNTARLESFNPSIEPNGVGGTLFQNSGKYNLMNAPKFIDEPGEWCIDSEKGKVYWWPENVKDLQNAIAPNLTELVRLQGDEEEQGWKNQVEYVEFRNLTFKYADRLPENEWSENKADPGLVVRNAENPYAAIFMQGVEHCAVIDSKILYTGAYAIALDHYAKHNRIVRNELGNLGCGGVQLYGYGPGSGKTKDINTRNMILANHIHDLGLAPYQHSSAITIFGASNTEGKFNLIERVPYTAIMITGTDADSMNPNYKNRVGDTGFNGRAYVDTYGNLTQYGIREQELLDLGRTVTDQFNTSADNGRAAIPYQSSDYNIMEYNISRDYMLDMNDGGCYYAWSMGKNNEYNYNIAEKKQNAKHMCWPLYMDDYASYVRLEGNRIWATQIGSLDKSQGTNVWRDNQSSNNMANPPAGYEELQNVVLNTVENMGGYLTTEGGNRYEEASEITGIMVKADAENENHTLITMPDLPEGAVTFEYTRVDQFGEPPYIGSIVQAGIELNAGEQNSVIAANGRKMIIYALDENDAVVAYANIVAETEEVLSEMMLEDFEREQDGGFIPQYDWNVLHGAALQVEGVEGNHVGHNKNVDFKANLNAGNGRWTDYSVEMDVQVNEWLPQSPYPQYDNVTLAGHALNAQNSWMLILRKTGKFELNKFYANAGTKVADTDFSIEAGKWYQIKLEFRGNVLYGYVSEKGQEYGEPQIVYEDVNNSLAYGGIELNSLGADFCVDNIRVTGSHVDMCQLLNDCLERAKLMDLSSYTEKSTENLRKAMEAAEQIVEDANATQFQLEDAMDRLEKAISGLEEKPTQKPADKSLLQKTYDYASALSTDGVVDSAKEFFDKALAHAKEILDKENATQEEINAAWDQLLEGIWGLGIVKGDKEMLEILVDKADTMISNANKYVEANWSQLVDALAKAKEVYDDGDALQNDVDGAAEGLLNAILAQRFKADKTNLEDLLKKVEGFNLDGYTEESVQAFKAALARAMEVMSDDTLSENDQKIVDDALKALADAKDALESKDTDGDKKDDSKAPATNDSMNMVMWMVLISIAAVTVSFVKHKKED